MTTRRRQVIPGWTAILAARHDADTFARDMNRLRTLGAGCLAAAQQLPAVHEPTIYSQLLPAYRDAVCAPWPPDFATQWAAAAVLAEIPAAVNGARS
jgi:hypothetical protein